MIPAEFRTIGFTHAGPLSYKTHEPPKKMKQITKISYLQGSQTKNSRGILAAFLRRDPQEFIPRNDQSSVLQVALARATTELSEFGPLLKLLSAYAAHYGVGGGAKSSPFAPLAPVYVVIRYKHTGMKLEQGARG